MGVSVRRKRLTNILNVNSQPEFIFPYNIIYYGYIIPIQPVHTYKGGMYGSCRPFSNHIKTPLYFIPSFYLYTYDIYGEF